MKMHMKIHKDKDAAYLLNAISRSLRSTESSDCEFWPKSNFLKQESADDTFDELYEKYKGIAPEENSFYSDFAYFYSVQLEEAYTKGMIGGFKLCMALLSGDEKIHAPKEEQY